jgi:hypothetical protein
MKTNIKLNAPVVTSKQIFVNSSPEIVWEALTQIRNWKQWNTAVQQVDPIEMVSENLTFKWKANGIPFTSTIHTLNKEDYLLGWTGKTIGVHAIHNWKLQSQNGATLVYTEESLDGILPKLFRKKFQETLTHTIANNLNDLKTFCEKKASST